MDPMTRARDYLLDNVGHMTRPGRASYDPTNKRWIVPIRCRTAEGDLVVGDIEVDCEGHIVFAPTREQIVSRLQSAASEPLPQSNSE